MMAVTHSCDAQQKLIIHRVSAQESSETDGVRRCGPDGVLSLRGEFVAAAMTCAFWGEGESCWPGGRVVWGGLRPPGCGGVGLFGFGDVLGEGGGDVHVEVFDEEGVLVGGEVDALGERHAGAVAGAGFDADEDGVGSGLILLQSGGELEAVGGEDAVVVVGGGDEGG